MGLLYKAIFDRNPGPLAFLLNKKKHRQEYYDFRDYSAAELEGCTHSVFELKNRQGQKLRAFYYPASDKPSDTVAIIVHGYRSNHAETAGMFRNLYHRRGIDILAVDNPAAGQSEGTLISFGVYESEAVLLWINDLLSRFGNNLNIILHGFSMGGCAVLLAGDRVPDNVRFIIDDCGVSGASAALKPHLGIFYEFFNLLNLIKSGFRVSFGMTEASPHLENVRCPVLFVHGKKDLTVPFRVGKQLYGECPSYRDCLWVEDAGHMESFWCAPEEYADKLDEFRLFFG